MRRAARTYLPALSRTYGLMPWHLDDLPPAELDEYLADLEDLADAAE